MMDPLSEPTLQSQILYEGKILRLEQLQVRLPNGRHAQRDIVRHPGAVALLALLDEGQRALLVRQYRKAAEAAFWEIPAGTLEPGESALACAQRELNEETGYEAKTLTPLQRFYTAPGFCDEQITLFRAEGLFQSTKHAPPEDEFMQVQAFTLAQAQALLEQGQICDAKTMLALALWRLRQ